MSSSSTKKFFITYLVSLVLLCAVGPISFSVISIPLTLQTLVLCVIAYWFGWPALLSCISYILLGLAGAPIFSGYAANPIILTTTSAGFVLAFPIIILTVLSLKSKWKTQIQSLTVLFIIAHIVLILSAYLFNTFLDFSFISLDKIAKFLLPSLLVKSVLAAIIIRLMPNPPLDVASWNSALY